MKVAGLIGWHNSGKTTLVVALVGELAARGYRVSTIKHAHHAFDVDTPGKDSWRHREAGATEVMVGSGTRWALMHELRGEREPELAELLTRMSAVDLVIVEGFKNADHEKIEVYRAGLEDPPLAHTASNVVAVATNTQIANLPPGTTCLDMNDPASVADFVERHWSLTRPSSHPNRESA